jgi:thiamine-phosphate pyrophosphorylase
VFDTPAERLYPIVDTEICQARGFDPESLALACLQGGARVVQLRVKSGSSARFLELAERLVDSARRFGAAVIVNDRADIGRMAKAAGVHVGQDDLPPEAVRDVFGDGVIGCSTHDPHQADGALQSVADYVAVGPIFATATKATGYTARGFDLLRHASGRGKPVIAIGGITLDRAAEVVAAGASSVAVITDLLAGGDPESRVRAYIRALQ